MVLACNDVDGCDVDAGGGDVDEDDGNAGGDDFDDDGEDVLACAPSSIVQSTAHECQGFQSPSSPDKELSFGWMGGLKSQHHKYLLYIQCCLPTIIIDKSQTLFTCFPLPAILPLAPCTRSILTIT